MRYIDETVYQLATRRGYVDAFWLELRRQRAVRPDTSHEEVYEFLEGLYEKEFGAPQFRTFGAFRLWRDRHSVK